MIKGLRGVRRALKRIVTWPPAPLAFDAVRKGERANPPSQRCSPALSEVSLMPKRV
jgi:hypothetical protein